MSAISAALGGSKGTLESYFPSKEDLFEAVVEEASSEYREHLAIALRPADSLRSTLKEFAHSLMEKINSAEALSLHRLVVAENGRFPEIGRVFYERRPQRICVLLAEFVGRQMEQGHLRQSDPVAAARALISLCTGGSHQDLLWGRARPTRREQDAQAAGAVEYSSPPMPLRRPLRETGLWQVRRDGIRYLSRARCR